jgi:hypothetical protein
MTEWDEAPFAGRQTTPEETAKFQTFLFNDLALKFTHNQKRGFSRSRAVRAKLFRSRFMTKMNCPQHNYIYFATPIQGIRESKFLSLPAMNGMELLFLLLSFSDAI